MTTTVKECPKECPICMDDICLNVNCVTTECGHQFHTSCLMQNVAHNGFGCPYCRNTLAEYVKDEEDTDYEDSDFEVPFTKEALFEHMSRIEDDNLFKIRLA